MNNTSLAPELTVVILSDSALCDGGAAKVAIDSAIGLARRGLRVIFVGGSGEPDPVLAKAGVEVVRLNQPTISSPRDRALAAFTALWNISAARTVDRVLAPLNPVQTVVHLHTWTKVLSASVLPVVKRRGMPLLITLHDYFTACPNGGFYDYQADGVCHRRPMSVACLTRHCDARHATHKMWRNVRQFIQSSVGGMPAAADAFIAVSDFSHAILQPYLPPATPVYRVNNPVDSVYRSPSDPAAQDGVLFIGRLSHEKGAHVLAAAAMRAGVTVTFAGDGPLMDTLRTDYPQHRFTGWCDRSRLMVLLNETRALILPALWYETLGLVVLEAAAQGVPAVVSTTCAASEVVAFEETGLGFSGGDEVALTACLQRLADNELVARLGRNAYERFWAAPPDLDRHCSNLLEVYRVTLDRRHVQSSNIQSLVDAGLCPPHTVAARDRLRRADRAGHWK